MTDAHFHRGGYATFLACADRETAFYGLHPWQAAEAAAAAEAGASAADFKFQISNFISVQTTGTVPSSAGATETNLKFEILDLKSACALVRMRLEAEPRAGVGEIGLDRLRTKTVTPAQRALFTAQLALAAELGRPVVLHGAKCWGEVVKACAPLKGRIPAFLFHGFSRSAGLLPDIFALNGFVSLGPALLNDHAVNYREMAKALPLERVLLETDQEASPEQDALIASLAAQLGALRGEPADAIAAAVEANARRFTEALA